MSEPGEAGGPAAEQKEPVERAREAEDITTSSLLHVESETTDVSTTLEPQRRGFIDNLFTMMAESDSQVVEWEQGRIMIRNPVTVEKVLLPKYFRHSNYASLQRQLNNFGFKKIAGKGKMSACIYAHPALHHTPADTATLLQLPRQRKSYAAASRALERGGLVSPLGPSPYGYGTFYPPFAAWPQNAQTSSMFQQQQQHAMMMQQQQQQQQLMMMHLAAGAVPPGGAASEVPSAQEMLYPWVGPSGGGMASSYGMPLPAFPAVPLGAGSHVQVGEQQTAEELGGEETATAEKKRARTEEPEALQSSDATAATSLASRASSRPASSEDAGGGTIPGVQPQPAYGMMANQHMLYPQHSPFMYQQHFAYPPPYPLQQPSMAYMLPGQFHPGLASSELSTAAPAAPAPPAHQPAQPAPSEQPPQAPTQQFI